MRVTVLMSALLVIACATGAPTSGSPPSSVTPSSVASESASPTVAPAGSGIAAGLPTELGGVTLLPPQPMTTEFLGPLAQQLNVDPSTIEGALVTTSGSSAGPEIAVVRVPGVSTEKLVDTFMAFNAQAFDIPASAKPTRERIGGKDVAVIRTPTLIVVVYGRGDTAYMVSSSMPQVVEEALSKLP